MAGKPASTNPFEFKSYCRSWINSFENILDHVVSINMNSQSLGWWAYVHVLHFSLTNEQVPVPKALYRRLCRLVGKDFALYQPTQLRKLLARQAQVSFSKQTELKLERNSPQWCWWQKRPNWWQTKTLARFDTCPSKLATCFPCWFCCQLLQHLKWGASSRWPFGLNPRWGSLETTTSGKTHPTLLYIYSRHIRVFF